MIVLEKIEIVEEPVEKGVEKVAESKAEWKETVTEEDFDSAWKEWAMQQERMRRERKRKQERAAWQ